MLPFVALGILLSSAPFAVAQLTLGSPQQQQNTAQPGQPGMPSQPSQPGSSNQSNLPEEQNGAAAPPTFAPGAGGSAASNDTLRDAPKVVRVSGRVMSAQLVHRVDPVYAQNTSSGDGNVVLLARIGKDGKVKNVSVVSCPMEMQRASVDAVRQWVYKPYLLNGEPVEVDTTVVLHPGGSGGH